MDINQINERLKNLYILQKNRDIYNKKAILFQNEGVQFETVINQIEKPITDKLGIEGVQTRKMLEIEGTQTRKEIEGVKNEIENQSRIAQLQYDDPIENGPPTKFFNVEPIFYDIKVNNEAFKTAYKKIPTINKNDINKNNIFFQSIIINNIEFIICLKDGLPYIFKYTTSPDKYKPIELTIDLLNLILGDFNEKQDVNEMKKYLEILKDANCDMSGNYVKMVNDTIKGKTLSTLNVSEKEKKKKKKEGEGISRSAKIKKLESINQNPITLFAELYKMLAARAAGHNNLDKPIRSILVKLVPHMRGEKKEKIIKKYNLR